MNKQQKQKRLIRQKKLMRYLAKPGYVGNMILLPVTKVLSSTELSYSDKLIYGELFTIFNTCSQFQLNKQLLAKPLNAKDKSTGMVTSGLSKLAKMNLISIIPVYDHYGYTKKTHKPKKKVIGHVVVNHGLNKLSAVNSASVKSAKSDRAVAKQKKATKAPMYKVAHQVIQYLNKKTGKHRRFTKNNEYHIIGREKDGYKLSDFKKVINNKCRDWIGTSMAKYLRPATLFIPSHFEDYLLEDGNNNKSYSSKYNNYNYENTNSGNNSNSDEGDYYGLKF